MIISLAEINVTNVMQLVYSSISSGLLIILFYFINMYINSTHDGIIICPVMAL